RWPRVAATGYRTAAPADSSSRSRRVSAAVSLCYPLHISMPPHNSYDRAFALSAVISYAYSFILLDRHLPRRLPMNDFSGAASQAASLIASGDPQLVDIVALSLRVSLAPVVFPSAIGA